MKAQKMLQKDGCPRELIDLLLIRLISLGKIKPETWEQGCYLWSQTKVNTPERKRMFAEVKEMTEIWDQAIHVWVLTQANTPERTAMFTLVKEMTQTWKQVARVLEYTEVDSEWEEIFAVAQEMAEKLLADA